MKQVITPYEMEVKKKGSDEKLQGKMISDIAKLIIAYLISFLIIKHFAK